MRMRDARGARTHGLPPRATENTPPTILIRNQYATDLRRMRISREPKLGTSEAIKGKYVGVGDLTQRTSASIMSRVYLTITSIRPLIPFADRTRSGAKPGLRALTMAALSPIGRTDATPGESTLHVIGRSTEQVPDRSAVAVRESPGASRIGSGATLSATMQLSSMIGSESPSHPALNIAVIAATPTEIFKSAFLLGVSVYVLNRKIARILPASAPYDWSHAMASGIPLQVVP